MRGEPGVLHTPLCRFESDTQYQQIGGCYDIAKRNTNGVPKRSVNGLSQKFKRKTILYKHFASLFGQFDFSDESMVSLYNHESYGTELNSSNNGFAVGKKWLNWHITNWKQGLIEGSLTRYDLLSNIPDVEGYKEVVDKVLFDTYTDRTLTEIQECATWWEVKPPR